MIQTYLIEQYDLKYWKEKSFNWAQAFVNTPLIFTKVTTSLDVVHDCDINVLTKSNNKTCYYREYELVVQTKEMYAYNFTQSGDGNNGNLL
ncbi:phage tail protein [Aggregatibacter actinomycetemcomitans]|uniref:phage tail protein n=2 Tax=Aggregatibacter actinomycetemcomitans TaxID=714 RepID=UPI0021CCBA1F|nr:phage tail protein [Aggregatibacter actinomycetemcomitans]